MKAAPSGRMLGVAAAPFMYVYSLLLSPPHPSQAIRELQEEVSRLQLQLEDSLHQPPQDSPTRPASTHDRPARARHWPADSPAAWGSHYGRWVTPKLPPLGPGGSHRRQMWLASGSFQMPEHRHSHAAPSLPHSLNHSFTYVFFTVLYLVHKNIINMCVNNKV